ncbi:hypothetical protein U9M48_033230 [Paspalum notatum var. saurae]|uniref:Uncharacterized protein n=1 Tax=Paspalum notatum var. saurae TaxID=547442 RepID=A0AAQ3U6F1_PASNO
MENERQSLPLKSVASCFEDRDWDIQFWRSLGETDFGSWQEMMNLLQKVQSSEEVEDRVIWELDRSKSFTTKSLYGFITDRRTWLILLKEKDSVKVSE